ncbi:MAG TPA: signal peptidase I [Phycisphaerae bacterium]|nr:signal peptidase I [Phycisphaerae bacterium]
MWAVLILAAALGAGLLMTAGILAGAGKWLKYGNASFSRALLTAVVLLVFGAAIRAGELLTPESVRVGYAAALLVELAGIWWLIKVMHRTTVGRAAAGMGLVVLGSVVAVVGTQLVVRPLVAEAYVTASNGMVPTLRAEGVLFKCPSCGADLYLDVDRLKRGAGSQMVCETCGQWITMPSVSQAGPVFPADRVLAVRFLTPRRWDVVTMNHKGDAWVKRVLGLPGETVMIDAAGNVSINGAAVSADPTGPTTFPWPAQWQQLPERYLSPGKTVTLGADEYFLVGDAGRESVDSRFTGPVKRKDVEGVVSAIYWPLGRVRLFR